MVALVLLLSEELLLLEGWGVVGMLLRLGELVVPLVEGPGWELAVFECCFDVIHSLSKLSCEEETVLALCARVLNTLCLAVMWWLLSQCKY